MGRTSLVGSLKFPRKAYAQGCPVTTMYDMDEGYDWRSNGIVAAVVAAC